MIRDSFLHSVTVTPGNCYKEVSVQSVSFIESI